MPNYYVNEAVFALPERGFVDRTIHSLESLLSHGGDDPLKITIRRVPLAEGESLRELVDEEVAASTAKLKGFTILDDAEVAVARTPGILLRARWRAGDIAHHQRQAHFAVNGTWLALAVTGPYAERATCDEAFDHIVQSLEWRRG